MINPFRSDISVNAYDDWHRYQLAFSAVAFCFMAYPPIHEWSVAITAISRVFFRPLIHLFPE